MSTPRQIIYSAGVVALALGAVGIYAVTGSGQAADNGMEGHNHAAMVAGGDELRPVRLGDEAARRIGVTYATAEHGPLERTVRVVGLIAPDETRLVSVSPKVEGWVERLHVDFTGAPVRAGEPMLSLYSPALVATQEELILARRLLDETAGAGGRAEENARALLESARRRLRYWDVADAEISRIEANGSPQKTLVLRAPASGLVLEKHVVEGGRVSPGTELYRIADLSHVWIEGEVFEQDLALVSVGQHARITLDAYPGRSFEGMITYVYPTISTETRTGRIRLELDNPDHALRPGMYASVEFAVPVHREGIHVPRSAVLETGERAIVFVRDADGALVPREIQAGLAAGEHIEVLAGLEAGEIVVATASFLVDAEANLGTALGAMDTAANDAAAMDHSGHGEPMIMPPATTDDAAPMDHTGHGEPMVKPQPTAEPQHHDAPAPTNQGGHTGHTGHAGH